MDFKVGDKVRTLAVKTRTEYANSVYANRNGTVTEISYPVGTVKCYKVVLDEPFYDHGCPVNYLYVYDYNNGEDCFELRNEEG